MKISQSLFNRITKLCYAVALIVCLLLVVDLTAVQAQLLQLKPKQKFTYEALNTRNKKTDAWSSASYTYRRTNFEVLKYGAGKYTIKVSPALILDKQYDGIYDSSLPLDEQVKQFTAVAGKVMTTLSYTIVVDKAGNIVGLQDTAGIKDLVLAKVRELKVPEKYQKNQEIANAIFQAPYFKLNADFFKIAAKKVNKSRIDKKAIETNTFTFKKEGVKDPKTGLVLTSVFDSTANKSSTGDNKYERFKELDKFGLVTGKTLPLFAEASKTLNYATYYSPVNKAKRTIAALIEYYHANTGKQGISDEIMHKLDSLDRLVKADDYEYLAAKLTILDFTGDGYYELLQKVPFQFITNDQILIDKISGEVKKGNMSNLPLAMRVLFTKMTGDNKYPPNINNLCNDLHDGLSAMLTKTNDPGSIKKLLDVIAQAEQLHIPAVTEFFAGIKTYCLVKLTNDQQQLNTLMAKSNNTLYDKAARYRTLIYDELVKKHVPDSVLTLYNDYTIEMVRNNIAAINSGLIAGVSDFTMKYELVPRKVVYKKYLADAYYHKSMLQKDQAAAYLQIAADYLPTQQDIADRDFDLKAEYKFLPYRQYTDMYLKVADKGGVSNEATLKRYVDLVIIEPERYTLLKEKYTKVYPSGDFKKFFNDALIEKLPAVPEFALNERAGKPVAKKDLTGKFTFVDFWGTWCGSCVAEIHKVEELKQANPAPERLLVSTIACYDKKKNVDDFMAKEKYTYQVLMSDGKVENDFKITGYPTKVLLLPNGVYLTISFFSDYKAILQKYLKWEI